MMTSLIALILVMLGCIQVARGGSLTANGYPRPKNIPDTPNVAWGKLPVALNIDTLQPGVCDWYGWINVNYQADAGGKCMSYIWNTQVQVLSSVGGPIWAFTYFQCSLLDSSICYDKTAFDIICTVGCFDLSNTTLALPPVTNPPSATPPGVPGTPPGTNMKGDGGTFQKPSVLLLGGAVIVGAAAVIFNQLLGGSS